MNLEDIESEHLNLINAALDNDKWRIIVHMAISV
jgi:hypothetical protein